MDANNPTNLITIFENAHYQYLNETVLRENLLLRTFEENFTEFEKKLYQFFLSLSELSEDDKDFEFDYIWQWLGYNNKASAIRVLQKHFIYGVDYADDGNVVVYNTGRGGQNKLYLFISISVFKRFCNVSTTPRAKDIQNYFLKVENILLKFIGGSILDFYPNGI